MKKLSRFVALATAGLTAACSLEIGSGSHRQSLSSDWNDPGDPWDDDWNPPIDDDWQEPDPDDATMCDSEARCASGRECDVSWTCRDVVRGCPATDECLGDPPGYEPPPVWAGIDPAFGGQLGTGNQGYRLVVNLDFYADHLYGEGLVVDLDYGDVTEVIVSGSRDDSRLFAQILDVGLGRSFDATFSAELVSGSEIVGDYTWRSDEADDQGPMRLLRTSPCGCDPLPCDADDECSNGDECRAGACQPPIGEPNEPNQPNEPNEPTPPVCTADTDCPEGKRCIDACCSEPPPCESDSECVEGDICVDGACAPAECSRTCECEANMECNAGRCEPREDPRVACSDDCDCDLEGGQRCIDGYCEVTTTE